MWEIVFLANAIGAKYEKFIVPFTYFALTYHPRGFVEIVVVDHRRFVSVYEKQLSELCAVHGNTRFAVRSMDKPPNTLHIPNTYRFFEVPHTPGRYTYIMDVDVMLMENVVPQYEQNWPKDCAFNNIVRNPAAAHPRLTGMMMVRSAQYYTPQLVEMQNLFYRRFYARRANDEHVLHTIVSHCHKMPPREFRWRPVLGIHFSPNRGKNKTMELQTSRSNAAAFREHARRLPSLFALPGFDHLCAQLEHEFVIGE